jgi:hypothetical protein
MSHGETSRRDAASFERFEQRLEEQRAGRWSRPRFAGLALGGSLAAAAVLVLVARGPNDEGDAQAGLPLRYARHMESALAADTQAAPAPGQSSERLDFSDGSQVTLAPRAVAEVAEVSAHGARVRLARGDAEVAIQKRTHAAWQFQAGPYTVRVTGTAFKLSWSDELQQIEVGMHHGSVIVRGPLAPSGVTLRGGQRLVASERTHRLVVEDWTPEQQVAAREAVEAGKREAESALAAAQREARASAREQNIERSRARTAARDTQSSDRDWAKQVAQGQFESVLREAKAQGYARVLVNAQVSDLTALADAARYARKTALGRDALLALRERFPSSEMGRDSAFFLGRLSAGDSALDWYDRYLREQPEGTYVSQALGRSMMLRYEQGAHERAAQLAKAYLARFPGGPYAASAHKLKAPARVTPPTP